MNGDKMKMKDIAKELGVSIATVSRVVNGNKNVNKEAFEWQKMPIEILLNDKKLNFKKSPKTLDFSLHLLYNKKACKEMRWSRMWLHTYSK